MVFGSIPPVPAIFIMNKRLIYQYVYQEFYNRIYAFVEFDFEKWRGPSKEPLIIEYNGKTFKQTGAVSKEDYSWVVPLFKLPPSPIFLDGRNSLCDISFVFQRKTLIEFREYPNSPE